MGHIAQQQSNINKLVPNASGACSTVPQLSTAAASPSAHMWWGYFDSRLARRKSITFLISATTPCIIACTSLAAGLGAVPSACARKRIRIITTAVPY